MGPSLPLKIKSIQDCRPSRDLCATSRSTFWLGLKAYIAISAERATKNHRETPTNELNYLRVYAGGGGNRGCNQFTNDRKYDETVDGRQRYIDGIHCRSASNWIGFHHGTEKLKSRTWERELINQATIRTVGQLQNIHYE